MSEVLKSEIVFPKENKETPPGKLEIGVDLDGVVVKLMIWVNRLCKRGLGVDIKAILNKRPVDYWIHKWPEIQAIPNGPAFIKEVYRKTFIYEMAIPIPGSIETLNKWREQEHQISFITARSKEILGQITLDWLEMFNLDWAKERIFHTDRDKVDSKAREAQRLGLHIYMGDHAEAVKMITPSSLIVNLVLEHPWNIAEDIGFQSTHVKNWQEADRIVQEASRWHYFLHSTKS